MDCTVYDFDIDLIVEKLQQDLRLQDWDIITDICTMSEMLDSGNDRNTCANVTTDINRHGALIRLNADHEEMQVVYDDLKKTGWLYSLIHEMYHIIVNHLSFFTEDMINLSAKDACHNDYLKFELDTREEVVVNTLTRAFVNVAGIDWVMQYKKEDIDETKNTSRCKGKKD